MDKKTKAKIAAANQALADETAFINTRVEEAVNMLGYCPTLAGENAVLEYSMQAPAGPSPSEIMAGIIKGNSKGE